MTRKSRDSRAPLEKFNKLFDPMWIVSDENGDAYLIPIVGQGRSAHQVVFPIRSKNGSRFVRQSYRERHGYLPAKNELENGLDVLESLAWDKTVAIGVRTTAYDGGFAIDVGDTEWHRVIVRPHRWEVTRRGPLLKRGAGAEPLPIPIAGGDLALLRPLLNLASDDDWHMVAAWLVYALQPKGPYPILVLHGEPGSAKSTTARLLVALTDPNRAPLLPLHRDDHDLMLLAQSRQVIAFDNVSKIETRQKDGLCRLATGSGLAVRQLYTNAEMLVWNASRPVIVSSVSDLLVGDDLADRSLLVSLPSILDRSRRPETELLGEFNRVGSLIFGAMVEAAAEALGSPGIDIGNLPRMADFAKWSASAAPSWGQPADEWLLAFRRNRARAAAIGLDGDLVVHAVREILNREGPWEGTVGQLLNELNRIIDCDGHRPPGWPTSAKALASYLRHRASAMRRCGIEYMESRRGSAGYVVYLQSSEPASNEHDELCELHPFS